MPFKIQIIDRNVPVRENPIYINHAYHLHMGLNEPIQYETGAQAATVVQERKNQLPPGSPLSFRIVKIESANGESDDSWKERERKRLEIGYYTPVPWSEEYWFKASDYSRAHYCHMSRDKTAMIAYTESHDKGVADKQTRVRAGKYLGTYFGNILGADQIKFWSGKVSILTGETQEFRLAKTPDEIENVYCNGPGSCMSHDSDHYASPFHPTRVYGAGDLAVAYIERDDSIAARVICWPEKEIYSRVYGDGGVWSSQLESLLTDAGYARGSASEWSGARLIRHETDGDGFVLPYLDIPVSVTDAGEYLKTAIAGEIAADNEAGVTGSHDICGNCDSAYNAEEDGGYIESRGMQVCDSCYCNITFNCGDCDRTCHTEDSVQIGSTEESVCDSCADNYPFCENCNKRVSKDDIRQVEIEDSWYCESCYDDSCATCESCQESGFTKNMQETISDNLVCNSCEPDYVICVECNKADKSEEHHIDDDGDSWCSDCRQESLDIAS